eukprot:CAMPEP_0178420178 /NCGR_PEP_ID=MMETSP0689_2-20121128/25995_1 /TAXON_ID=160604 /ORGANISM="Amphidinium massartii, Strain CS-259" /LENGTH=128 /DNA_ID=CAMNT_0020041645 /DNA_START=80 /DNA_END=466 /DNA_ORIENTATION=+
MQGRPPMSGPPMGMPGAFPGQRAFMPTGYNGAPFTGVAQMPMGNQYGGGYGGGGSSRPEAGPADPLDAFMVSVNRELDRQNKGKKKKEKVGDVASARAAFGPQALQKLRGGGFEGRDTDTLLEDKLLK